MVDLPRTGEPGKTCWCWLISKYTVELYGKDTGLKLVPVKLVGRTGHRVDVECKKGCKQGIQSSLDTKFADDTLEITYTREKCCGECNLPKVECYGQSQNICNSGFFPIGKPIQGELLELWELRNDLDSSKDKIKDLCDTLILSFEDDPFCGGNMRCRRTKQLTGLCGEEPRFV